MLITDHKTTHGVQGKKIWGQGLTLDKLKTDIYSSIRRESCPNRTAANFGRAKTLDLGSKLNYTLYRGKSSEGRG